MDSSHLHPDNTFFVNLQNIANHKAYRTKAEEDAENASVSYHYESKPQ